MAHLICTGRLGGDAEVRTTTNGTKVVSFSLADDIGWGDKKRTQWIKCAMFGDRGPKVAPYLTKGSIVQIHGEPEAESWVKDGKAHGAIKVIVNDVKLFGGPKRDDEPVADRGRATRGHDDDMDQGIPF
jgi:single-strand DNA-binding protein